MLLIGITGRAGSGKDTVAEILKTQYDFTVTHFSYTLKRMISDLLGESYELWEDREWRERVHDLSAQTPRYMAQTLGTEWGRQTIHEDLWLIDTWNRLEKARIARAAIADVRFENEAHAIRTAYQGHVIHVERPNGEGIISSPNHSSEAGIEKNANDLVIINDGTLADLSNAVEFAMDLILEGRCLDSASL
jgi:hypothetical protein